jgi:hypothetical protein
VKVDFIAGRSKRIFVEKASLEHTQSHRFCYWIPNPYGFDVRSLPVLQLMQMYNERADSPRFDQGIDGLYRYPHGIAGDQANNEGMFLPLDVVKAVGLPPWVIAKELTQHE